ncbi:hypothetical protein LCGC14_2825710, partial [marine sediment metagenome]
ESDLAPVARGLEKGMEMGLKRQAVESDLRVKLAEQERKKTELNRKNTYKALEDLSMYMNSKKPEEQESFKQSDNYKQISDLVKAHLPEYWDKDKKEMMLIPNKQVFDTKISEIKAGLVQKALQGPLDANEQRALNVLNRGGDRMLAAAMAATASDPALIGASQQEIQRAVKERIGAMKGARESLYTDGLGGQPNGGGAPRGPWYLENE